MPRRDPFIARFLAGAPAELRDTFSSAQLLAITRAFGMRHARGHLLDIRRSLPSPWGRAYFVLLIGRDRTDGG